MSEASAVGFADVDHSADPEGLVASMCESDAHVAVQVLRLWTGAQLRLAPGMRLLDAGCGPGTAAVALADSVLPDGAVVGIDTSTVMIDAARRAGSGPGLAFVVGDACALAFPDAHFDAYRAERTWQWLADPALALAEALRVLRPGGRIALIDADWGTLALDHPDEALTARLLAARRPVPPSPWVGRQLVNMMRRAGLIETAVRAESLVATALDRAKAPGAVSFPALAEMAARAGAVTAAEADRWLAALEAEADAGRFFSSLTLFAAVGTKPG